MRSVRLATFAVIALAGVWASTSAQDKPAMAMDHAMVMPENVKWTDGPGSLPKGAQMSVLDGDPTKEGSFTMRIKLPANFRIPPHWHPADERVTVIQGTLYMGLGESFDDSKVNLVPTGGFAIMKMGTRHFAKSGNTETIVQLHGIGPWGINYVNPADDPRKSGH